MDNHIFREKSIARVSAPEDLNQYIRVASPGIWMLLAAVLALLVAFGAWSVLGRLDTTVQAAAVSHDGLVMLYVAEGEQEKLTAGHIAAVGDVKGQISSVSDRPVRAGGVLDSYGLHCMNLTEYDWVYAVSVELSLPDGVYTGYITVDSVMPASFVIG